MLSSQHLGEAHCDFWVCLVWVFLFTPVTSISIASREIDMSSVKHSHGVTTYKSFDLQILNVLLLSLTTWTPTWMLVFTFTFWTVWSVCLWPWETWALIKYLLAIKEGKGGAGPQAGEIALVPLSTPLCDWWWRVFVFITQSCSTLCDSIDCSLLGFSVHGILQARIIEWVAIPFFRGSSWPRDWT